ncbi:hypothetical protein ANOM_008148 [Aspergillus nomiae NRRL 13137]|uniref:Uncharacterized protein n=1 Tax=Aspergillus nomiae NRRL (strain ATCC 15546 / NRRL 13137 / CBS 260.88 / M93) TaxID=1509407 RepID=A0A0L1ITY7_ASPN3|nr:uncharacterized protein ANOM_008148 [Aspergillus nomiae NRRL 13137]KNG83041.1 hypothetical protein ANOM_008148 [Aspergillus nomiae NRRL 13137]
MQLFTMRPQILLHPQLRTLLPRGVRRDLNSTIFSRLKTTQPPFRLSKNETPALKSKENNATATRSSPQSATTHAKTTIRRGPPERILIYHGGTGKTIFLGMLRITTIFLFGVSVLVVAPAFAADEFPWYLAPAVVIGGALPMLFVSYTSAPFVNFVHLALPAFARRSKEQTLQYAKNLPPTATLYINTMKFTTIPRQTEVRLGDLVPDKAILRPVSFRNKNPAPLPWWAGKTLRQFYAAEKSQPGRESTTFYPELWEHVYKQIQKNPLPRK